MHHPHLGGLLIAVVVVIGVLFFVGQLSWWSAVIIAAFVGVPTYLVSRQIYRALRRPTQVGREALPGRRAVVVGRPEDGGYFVRIEGELWRAESPDELTVGERVYVLDVEDNHLIVCQMPLELN